MAERILGIDVQPSGVRCALLEKSLRQTTLIGGASGRLPKDAGPREAAQIVRRIMAASGLGADVFVLGLGNAPAIVRRLEFPFTSSQKIRQVLPLELEANLPLDMEDMAVSMVKSDRVDEGQAVLGAALSGEYLSGWVEAFDAEGIAPRIIDLSAGGLNALAATLSDAVAGPGGDPASRLVFLDVAPHSATLLYRVGGRVALVRTLHAGALDMGWRPKETDAEVATPEAEKSSDESPRAYSEAMDALVRDIVLGLYAYGEEHDESPPEAVIVSGEGAQMPEFLRRLGAGLEIPVRRVSEFPALMGAANVTGGVLPSTYAVAAGLARRTTLRGEGFNFRTGRFAPPGADIDWRRLGRIAAVVVLALGLSWGAAATTDILLKKQRLERMQTRMEQTFRQTLPDVKGNLTRAQYASVINTRLAQLSGSATVPGGAGLSATETLRRISQAVPRELSLTINLLSMDEQTVQISARADSFNTVETIKNRLQEVPGFSQVQIKGAKAAQGGKEVQFRLEIALGATREGA